MTEDEAQQWIGERFGTGTLERLTAYAELLTAENDRQNLVSPTTIPTLWARHIVDCAQLLDHAPDGWRHWVDIGAGAGLPGLVVAIIAPDRQVTLIEPRRLRADFLAACTDRLQLPNASAVQAKAERASTVAKADVISARAVAGLDMLLAASAGFADRSTTYIFPKGESAKSEVAVASVAWQGVFHVEQSIVDPKSGIVVASGIARR